MTDPRPLVVQLVGRNLRDDPRALRASLAAVDAGYRVTALCMLPEHALPDAVPGVDVVALRGGGLTARLRSGRPGGGPSPAPMRELRALWRIGRQLGWAIRATRRDPHGAIVHAHDLEMLPAGLALARTARLVYDAHELYADWDAQPSVTYRRWCLALERFATRRAAAVLTVSPGIADVLAERNGIVRPTVVLNVPRHEGVPAAAGPPAHGSRPRALYQGVFTPGRGLEQLVDAARLVPEVEICLRGFGPLENALRSRAAQTGATILPAVDPGAMVESLAGFQIGLVPYLPSTLNNELCLPNKLFEYLAGGLAVAASDLVELRHVVTRTGAGRLFEPGSSMSIASALRELSDDAALRHAQERAAAAAAGEYAWQRQASIVTEVYERACAA